MAGFLFAEGRCQGGRGRQRLESEDPLKREDEQNLDERTAVEPVVQVILENR